METPFLLSRSAINDQAWDACVAASAHRILYAYTWYLDAVAWRWTGLVLEDGAGGYTMVMPVPLRWKGAGGLGRWVVHQPLFCQYLGIFSKGVPPDPEPFFRVLLRHYPYGSVFHSLQLPDSPRFPLQKRQLHTHILNLSADYVTLRQGYSKDRQLNLRRAEDFGWSIEQSTDIEPLIRLFRENHAPYIPGTVADWAYERFRKLYGELSARNLVTLRYAQKEGTTEAGALFVREGSRIVYLFNAASPVGRRGNARTLLIDQVIRLQAGSLICLDFESPEKPSIAAFYRSFGAVGQPFWTIHYNRLSAVEKLLLKLKRQFVSHS